jgi:hypothetical protein
VKFLLVALMFIFLVLPTAIAIASGVPDAPALLTMAVLVVPFLYGVYGLLTLLFEKSTITDRTAPRSMYEIARRETLELSSVPERHRVLWGQRLVWTWSSFRWPIYHESHLHEARVEETFSSATFSQGDDLTNLAPVSELNYVRR